MKVDRGNIARAYLQYLMEQQKRRRMEETFPEHPDQEYLRPEATPSEEMMRGEQWRRKPEGNYRDEIPSHELLYDYLLQNPWDEYELPNEFRANAYRREREEDI